MLNPKLILSILCVLLAGGLTLLGFGISDGGVFMIIVGSVLTVLAAALLYIWWRANQIIAVSQAMGQQDFVTARQKLANIKNPEKLNALSKTYYYFLLGAVETQSRAWKEARAAYRTALETNRFRAIDDKATALIMLVQIELNSKNFEMAKRYMREARELKPGTEIQEQIKEIIRQTKPLNIRW